MINIHLQLCINLKLLPGLLAVKVRVFSACCSLIF